MIRYTTVLAAFLTVAVTVFAQDKTGPLAEMPSKPGAHVEKIKAMGDNFAPNTFFDRELNAYFCHVAGDSSDDGVMWLYRYKK